MVGFPVRFLLNEKGHEISRDTSVDNMLKGDVQETSLAMVTGFREVISVRRASLMPQRAIGRSSRQTGQVGRMWGERVREER